MQGKGEFTRNVFSPDFPIFAVRSKLYAADLESGLHYVLRVELAAHKSLAGAELRTLKDFVTVLAKVRRVSPGLREAQEGALGHLRETEPTSAG